MNYGNKNSSCNYTNTDLFKGYALAVCSAISVSLVLRRATRGLTKNASGMTLLFINTFVGATAGACANFANTMMMRMPEVDKGIEVFSDQQLTKSLGISKISAKSAVIETALSRIAMSIFCTSTPAVYMSMLSFLKIIPKN